MNSRCVHSLQADTVLKAIAHRLTEFTLTRPLLVTMASADQRYHDERPTLELIANRVISYEDFRECQRTDELEEFFVLVANGVNKETTDGVVALGVRTLEVWEEFTSGKIEQLTFESIMVNISTWLKDDIWQKCCVWLTTKPFYVSEEVGTILSGFPGQQIIPQLVLEATEESPAIVALVAHAVPIGVSTTANKSGKAYGVHLHLVDGGGTISLSARTKEELDHCIDSAIKARQAGYAHELELKRLTLAYEDKKEVRTHELEMAKLQQQPSTPRQDSPRQDLFGCVVPADVVHPQGTITPGTSSRKRLQSSICATSGPRRSSRLAAKSRVT
jgi:hypothetical protein